MRIDRYILILPALLAASVACQRQPEPEVVDGTPISFVATTAYLPEGEPGTRTVYSGEVISGRERIEWVQYDHFQVYCPEAGEVKSAFYYVEDETHESGSVESRSTGLILMGDDDYDALKWSGASTYHFFGRYPAYYKDGYGSDDYYSPLDTVFRSQNLSSSTFTCVIPIIQSATQDGNSNTWLPDMNYAYMTAYATAAKGDTDIVLPFTPVYNAFEITIPNDYPDNTFVVKAVVLEASARRLNGTYKVGIAPTPVPLVPASSDEDDRWVGAVFIPEATVPSGAENALVCTLFTCPVKVAGTDEDHLSVYIYYTDQSVRILPLKNGDGSWVACSPCSKTRVTCPTVPNPHETNYGMVLSTKNLVIDSGSSSGTVSVASFASTSMQPTPAPWSVEYSADGTAWSSTAPASGVYASPSSGNGNLSGETVTINKTSGYSGTYYVRFTNAGTFATLKVTVNQ